MTKALSIITRSLRQIGAYSPGDDIDPEDANDALEVLNDLLDLLSNQKLMIPYITEIIFPFQNNVQTYTIGPGGTIGGSAVGSISLTTLTITSVSSGNIALGQYITGASVEPGTKIVAFIAGSGGTGTYKLNISQNISSITLNTYYERPLRINSGFTRVGQLDYTMDPINIEQYELIGLKTLQGPWPRLIYYQPSYPVGNVTFWPTPTAGEAHVFVDTILGNFQSLKDEVNLPQGYKMSLSWLLSEQLLTEYGISNQLIVSQIKENSGKARAWIKSINSHPPQFAQFDAALIYKSRRRDSSYIYTGGFS